MRLYFIALVPEEELNGKIKDLKEEIAARHNASHALKLPAHITLLPPFKMNKKEEDLLLMTLDRTSCRLSPFKIELLGFGSFPPRVIFVKIKDPHPVRSLYNELQEELRTLIAEEYLETRDFHPHITIATKDLVKKNYKNAWKEFRKRDFSENFMATRLSLFRHNGKSWEIQKEFNFSS